MVVVCKIFDFKPVSSEKEMKYSVYTVKQDREQKIHNIVTSTTTIAINISEGVTSTTIIGQTLGV
jgi:hypothetical protein